MAGACSHGFELTCTTRVVDLFEVKKYKSLRTGLTVCMANVSGPLVNGYFCVATEAHDDDGLPHTLEHLVFMGSEQYPFKGLLDLLANRCLAQGTNAWTDVDHTAYTLTTAGSEGFLNMLPIYMDHILYPTLTKSAYTTEVHHINGEGEDAGIVYCEMQARENSGSSRTHLELTRSMYPGQCGYKSETGGLTKNLRTSCSHEKVCNYHASYYRPDNLCVIVTGQVEFEDVLKELSKYEERIISKGELSKFTRPWETPVPPLSENVERVVEFPTEDESNGLILIGWRGPNVKEYYEIAALNIIMQYLTETSAAELQKELVEIDDPFCSDLDFSMMENLETCFYLKATGVPKDKLYQLRERVEKVLYRISSGELALDMERLHTVIHREILNTLDKYEDSPHDIVAQGIIGDFLYSSKPDDLIPYLDDIPRLEKLRLEPETYWIKMLQKYFIETKKVVPLRNHLINGDFFVGSAIGSTLTKIALRFIELERDVIKQNRFCAEAMLIMASMIHLGKSGIPKKAIGEDDLDRLATCVKSLAERNSLLKRIFSEKCRAALSVMLEENSHIMDSAKAPVEKKTIINQPDDSIAFLQLFAKSDQGVAEDQLQLSLLQAIGNPVTSKQEDMKNSKLSKVAQLTGFSDPIYAEAYVNVNQYDIVLDVLIVNQTADTLQNVTLELATLGDLKLVEKPSPITLAPHDFSNIKASVKVASTENGIIFGNIVYDISGGTGDRNCVVLNDIHIDVMDYIVPATCTDTEFRSMWAEFEWENKVSVNTNITDLREYLDHIVASTNMKCLTPEKALSGDCGFMAANFYAKSIFGEDALANLSIEKPLGSGPEGQVTGHIRIRAKSQGMALSLGDKINLSQKKLK